MQEKLMGLWAKVVENKAIAIRIAGALVGAMVGTGVAAVIANAQNQSTQLTDDDILDLSDDNSQEL